MRWLFGRLLLLLRLPEEGLEGSQVDLQALQSRKGGHRVSRDFLTESSLMSLAFSCSGLVGLVDDSLNLVLVDASLRLLLGLVYDSLSLVLVGLVRLRVLPESNLISLTRESNHRLVRNSRWATQH